MKRLFVLSGLLLLLATPAMAQHPCDTTSFNNQATNPFKVGFCEPANSAILSFKLLIDGNQVTNTPLTPVGAANSAGLLYYEFTNISSGKGNHSIVVVAVLMGSEVRSTPFDIVVADTLPPAPTKIRLGK